MLSVEEIEDMVEVAKEYLQANGIGFSDELIAKDFAETIVQLFDACMIGRPCKEHLGAVHGHEAEELRAGIERILGNTANVRDEDAVDVLAAKRKALVFLLDHVNARDSLAYLETRDRLQAVVDAVTDADIAALPPEVRAARLAHQFPASDLHGVDEGTVPSPSAE